MTFTTQLANQLESSELGSLIELYSIQYAGVEINITPSEGGFTFDGKTYYHCEADNRLFDTDTSEQVGFYKDGKIV